MTELADLYRELGFSVKISPSAPDRDAVCRKCFENALDRLSALYTKKKQ
ncbi:MAG: hypothetical protein V6Z89_01070 [Desulfobacter sp.]